jgi:hypothetical protein
MAEENRNDYTKDEPERIEDVAYAPGEFLYDQPADDSAYRPDEEYLENLLQQIDEVLHPPTLASPEISGLLVWQVQEGALYATEQQSDDPGPLEPDEAISPETQEALGQVPWPWLADDGTFENEEAVNDYYTNPDDYSGI